MATAAAFPQHAQRAARLRRDGTTDLTAVLDLPTRPGGIETPVIRATPGELASSAAATLVVVEGAVLSEVRLGNRLAADLLGSGDVLRPRDESRWVWEGHTRALTSTRFAVLLRSHEHAAAIDHAVLRAAHRQGTRALAWQALHQTPQLDRRLEILLGELADRWGVVTTDGVLLPAFLGHTTLAALLGVRRPSFTTAAQRFTADGRLVRLSDGRWRMATALAHGEPL